MSEQLTREILEQLRKPFPASKISFKCQTKPSEKGNSLVVAYIDARDVMDRLDEVVGPDWSTRFEWIGDKAVMCYLTVCGVTRADVSGQDSDNEPVKSAVSDALKRAAVNFGIGRFLYDLPKMWAKARAAGKSFVLEDGEIERLRREVDNYLAGKRSSASSANPDNGNGHASHAAPKPAAPARAAQPAKVVEEPSDLRKRHGELWMQCTKAGLVKGKEAVQAWSVTPATSDAEIEKKIAGMEAALKTRAVKA